MSIYFSKVLTLALIELWESHTNLYDMNHKDFNNKSRIQSSIKEISDELVKMNPNITPALVQKKMSRLRSRYIAEIRGESEEDDREPLWCFRELQFLNKYYGNLRSASGYEYVSVDDQYGVEEVLIETNQMHTRCEKEMKNESSNTRIQKYAWLGAQIVFEMNKIEDEVIQDETVSQILKILKDSKKWQEEFGEQNDIPLPEKRKKRKIWMKHRRDEQSAHLFDIPLDDEDTHSVDETFVPFTKFHLNKLEEFLKQDIQRQNTVMREAVTTSEKLAAVLRFYITGETYVNIMKQTKLSTTYLVKAVPEVSNSIWRNMKQKYLKFPTTTLEWDIISESFHRKHQFPNCLGVLIEKHIKVRHLRKKPNADYRRKGSNSVILLALLDANYKFLYVDVECKFNSNNDNTYEESALQNVIHNSSDEFPADRLMENNSWLPYVFAGSCAFPLYKYIMTPYSYQTKKREKLLYNARLSEVLDDAEFAWSLLSNRFKILQGTMALRMDTVQNIIQACCVLHNFLLDNDREYVNSFKWSNLSNSVVGINKFANKIGYDKGEEIRQEFVNYFKTNPLNCHGE